MTNLKNKLSASVRQAQSVQADSVAAKKSVKRAATQAAPEASMTAVTQPQPATGRHAMAVRVATGSALFPNRVWPD